MNKKSYFGRRTQTHTQPPRHLRNRQRSLALEYVVCPANLLFGLLVQMRAADAKAAKTSTNLGTKFQQTQQMWSRPTRSMTQVPCVRTSIITKTNKFCFCINRYCPDFCCLVIFIFILNIEPLKKNKFKDKFYKSQGFFVY